MSFLKRCRDSDIIPKFLSFRVPSNGCFDDQTVHNFQRRLLHKEIDKALKQLKEHSSNLDGKRSTLKSKTPYKVLPSIIFHSRLQRRKNRKLTQTKHEKKIHLLSQRQNRPLFNVENTVIFSDFAGHVPNYVKETLALGPRHPVMKKFNE